MEDFFFVSEGDRIHAVLYEAPEGKAPHDAVIFCHGAFESSAHWSDYARRLADQGFTALAVDFVGHGTSDGLRGLVDLRRWAYNLRDAMNALTLRGYRRFAVVGWDSGGSAALLAAAHDRRMECVVTLATPVNLTPLLSERIVFTLMTGWSKVRSLFTKKPLTLSRAGAYDELCFAVDSEVDGAYKNDAYLQEILAAVPVPQSLDSVWVDITTAVKNVNTPVLVMHGRDDDVIPMKQSEKLLKLLPGHKKLVLVENAGHALHLDQKKDEVYITIARWIKHYLN
ncbi:MAG: alpha/beta hydrolase [Bellilinea sp.]